jgi:CspA family cold shock protein
VKFYAGIYEPAHRVILFSEFRRRYHMPKGTIRSLITDRGFGFIRTAEGTDLFFHRSELQGVDYSSLRTGEQVEFELGKRRDSRPQAVKVRLTQPKSE